MDWLFPFLTKSKDDADQHLLNRIEWAAPEKGNKCIPVMVFYSEKGIEWFVHVDLFLRGYDSIINISCWRQNAHAEWLQLSYGRKKAMAPPFQNSYVSRSKW